MSRIFWVIQPLKMARTDSCHFQKHLESSLPQDALKIGYGYGYGYGFGFGSGSGYGYGDGYWYIFLPRLSGKNRYLPLTISK